MLNIKDILIYVHDGIEKKDARFQVEDDEHVLDTKTGVEYHLYDNGGKITREDDLIAKMEFFTKEEQGVLFKIKKLITDPEVVQKKLAHYPIMVVEARKQLSDLYEFPEPVKQMGPKPEINTTPYKG